MLYKTASIITGLFYNFIFIKMKGPNKLLKLKLKLNKQFNYGPFQLKNDESQFKTDSLSKLVTLFVKNN